MVDEIVSPKLNFMTTDIAKYLIEEFSRQFPIVPIDDTQKKAFVSALEQTEVPDFIEIEEKNGQKVFHSKGFDLELVNGLEYKTAVRIDEETRETDLYLTRIIRNRNVENLNMNLPKYLREKIWGRMNWYSSKFPSRHIRQNKELVSLLSSRAADADGEYLKDKPEERNYDKMKLALSLLFRFKQIDYEKDSQGREVVAEINRPILIVPGVSVDERKFIEDFEIDQGKVIIDVGRWPKERRYIMGYRDYSSKLSTGKLPYS
jgi:ribonuclease D